MIICEGVKLPRPKFVDDASPRFIGGSQLTKGGGGKLTLTEIMSTFGGSSATTCVPSASGAIMLGALGVPTVRPGIAVQVVYVDSPSAIPPPETNANEPSGENATAVPAFGNGND